MQVALGEIKANNSYLYRSYAVSKVKQRPVSDRDELKQNAMMSNTYCRDCKYCGRPIRMAEVDDGQWLAFEIDGSGKHHCGTLPIQHTLFPEPPPEPTEDHSSLPRQHKPSIFEKEDKGAKMDRFFLLVIALAMFFIYFYFSK